MPHSTVHEKEHKDIERLPPPFTPNKFYARTGLNHAAFWMLGNFYSAECVEACQEHVTLKQLGAVVSEEVF
jgi:hypothetical protein